MSLTLNEKIALLKQVGEEIVDLHELEDICRCETIPEKEIINAIHASVGAVTLDGVKFRCRPGMGRCQGGFCRPRFIEILSREFNIPYEAFLKIGLDLKQLGFFEE